MKKLFITILLTGFFLTLGTGKIHAASVSWDGGGWSNWTPSGVPTSSNDVTIDRKVYS